MSDTDKKLDEIRARHEHDQRWRNGPSMICPHAHDDRGWLLSEIERQARHIEELREKIDAERSCACAFDAPGDVCVAHSPALMQAQAEVERLRAENARLRAQVAEYFNEPATHPVEREE